MVTCNASFTLNEKLKKLKENLKKWNKDVFGVIDLNIEKVVLDLNEMDRLVANDDSGVILSDIRKVANTTMWQQLRYKESLLK